MEAFKNIAAHLDHASMYPPSLAEIEYAKAERVFMEVYEGLEDCIKQMEIKNQAVDNYFGFEIHAYTELLKKCRGEANDYDKIRYGS